MSPKYTPMKRKRLVTEAVREFNLTAENISNPLIDFADGGDFAVSNHIADIVGNDVVRLQMNVIILCSKGTLHVGLNGKEETLHANDILICPANTLLNRYDQSEDCELKTMCLSDRLIYNMLGDRLDVWIKSIFIDNISIVTLSETESKRMALYSQLSRSIIADEDIGYRSDLVRTQLEALMLELCGRLSMLPGQQMNKTSYSKMLFYKFLKLLSSAQVKRKPVKDYAGELAVTHKYLSFVCFKYSGFTALEWIDRLVMEDARYYLKSTDMSIKEIASRLGFPNNSFFGRYIVRHVGMSPISYRRSLKE